MDAELTSRATLARPAGFDFTSHMRRLCLRLVADLPELAHIDLSRLAIRFCQARKSVRHGLQASLTPLRFAGGAEFSIRRGRRYRVEMLRDAAGQEMLYLLSFYLPRFLDQPFDEKLVTVLHELWHISPAFDGDLRRHTGRCFAHGKSGREYDAQMAELTKRWLSLSPPAECYGFLRHSFAELRARHGAVVGLRVATPRIIRAP